MDYAAKVVLDSVSPAGIRLVSIQATYPRIIHDELLTHRRLCLAGDSVLEFDLPGSAAGNRRRYSMRLADFVDKWESGARRVGSKPKEKLDTGWIDRDKFYAVPEIVAGLGLAGSGNLNSLCRSGAIPAVKEGRSWTILGADVIAWRESAPESNRFDIRARLAFMRIRQLNEDTGDIQTSQVVNAFRSGQKEVYEVSAGDFTVAGSANHRVLTARGWVAIGDLSTADWLLIRRFGTPADEHKDPHRLRQIDGRWRSVWQREQRARLAAESSLCRRCQTRPATEIHHVEPVHANPARAFDESNITFLCERCHLSAHAVQGWQASMRLYAAVAQVLDVRSRGIEETYDLEIAGRYQNFLANGVVVHNSRNSRSSRAVPVPVFLREVEEHPYIPDHWGLNQRGMQAHQEADESLKAQGKAAWLRGRDAALAQARELHAMGFHKQVINYVLMPYSWITVLISATHWSNLFALRCHKDAHPAFQRVAGLMYQAYLQSTPAPLLAGEWHLPYVQVADRDAYDIASLKGISVARCARVSIKPFTGNSPNPEDDLRLYGDLKRGAGDGIGHFSPFEMVAQAQDKPTWSGNFFGWTQHRKEFHNEEIQGRAPGDATGRTASVC